MAREADDPERDAWVESVKQRLRLAMKARGQSHEGVSRALGKSRTAVSVLLVRGELGEWWTLYRMCEELKVSADELLGLRPVQSFDPALDVRARRRAEERLAKAEKMMRAAREELRRKR